MEWMTVLPNSILQIFFHLISEMRGRDEQGPDPDFDLFLLVGTEPEWDSVLGGLEPDFNV